MKFSLAIPVATLALGAVAVPSNVQYEASLVQRDVATISGVVSNINSVAGELATAINGFSGDVQSVEDAAAKVKSTIEEGVEKVKATSELTLLDALQLQPLVEGLTTTTNSIVDAAIAKKPDFVTAHAGATVLQQLKDQRAAAKNLADAITSKVPEAVRELAAQLSAGIDEAFARGIQEFADQEGQPTDGGEGSTAAPTPTDDDSGEGSTAAPTPTDDDSGAGSSSTRGPTGSVQPSGSASGSGKPPGQTSANPPKPTGSAPPPAFTGAASANQIGGLMVAVAVAVAAF